MDKSSFGFGGSRRGRSLNPDIGIRTLSSLLLAMAISCSSTAQRPSGAGGSAGQGVSGAGGTGGGGAGGAGGTVQCSLDPPPGGCGCEQDEVFYECSPSGMWVCPFGTAPRPTCSCIGNDCTVDSGADASHPSIDTGGAPPPCAYRVPGCGEQTPPPVCDDGGGGACGGAVCDCQNMVHHTYCNRSDVPFRYFLAGGTTQNEGDACDPTPDAGPDH